MTPIRSFSKPILAATLLLAIAVPAGAAETLRDPLLATKLAQSYVVADLTGDGIADIAVVDFLTDTLAVLAGDGRGGFRRAASLRVGAGPRAVVASDFNGDGRPDLAIASFFAGEVAILLGTGTGQFEKPLVTTVGPGVSSVVAGDFTGDGAADLVAANFLTGDVTLLAGTGAVALLPFVIGNVAGPTQLVAPDPGPDGRRSFLVLDAAGRMAWQLDGDDVGTFSTPVFVDPATVAGRLDARAAARQDAKASAALRVRAASGNGWAGIAGSETSAPFAVEVTDEAGASQADLEVVFTRLLSSGHKPGGHARRTDAEGRAHFESTLSPLPEILLVAAAGEGSDNTVLAAASALPARELKTLLARSPRNASTASSERVLAVFEHYLQQSDDGETVEAVRTLVEWINAEDTGTTGDPGLTRRVINQLLLFGAPDGPAVELTCDVPATGTISDPLESDFYTLPVADGDRVQVSVGAIAPSGSSFQPAWRLLTAAGVGAPSCGTFRTSSLEDCGPLPAGGNPYRIEVSDSFRDDTGTYELRVYYLPAATACEATALSCDTPVTGSISHRFDADLYTLPVADGDRVQVSVGAIAPSGSSFQPAWRLLTAAGAGAPSCGTFRTSSLEDCGPLPASGNPYRIEVMDSWYDDTGAYRVRMTSLVLGCLPPDLVVTSVTDPPAVAVLKQGFPITDTTKNQGAGAAPASRTRYYLSVDEAKSGTDKRLGAGRVVPALPAGTSSSGAKNVVVPPTTKLGLYFLLACADDTQVVDEGGVLEANNCRASTSKVEVRAPDLLVSAMTNPPETIARGGSFLAVETVRNLGNADTTATATTRFYLSLDAKKSGTDLLLTGTRAVGPLAVGGASAGNTTVGVPPTAVPGSYFLLACADDLKKVAEANTALTGEKNNCLASTTKVTVSP